MFSIARIWKAKMRWGALLKPQAELRAAVGCGWTERGRQAAPPVLDAPHVAAPRRLATLLTLLLTSAMLTGAMLTGATPAGAQQPDSPQAPSPQGSSSQGAGSSSTSSGPTGIITGIDVNNSRRQAERNLPSSQQVPSEPDTPPPPPPSAIDPQGAPVSLETNEALFDVAVGLNACGYDTGLEQSDRVRGEVRAEVNQTLQNSAAARDARDGLCNYIHQHRLSDAGKDLAQYVSLALYLTPPPALAASADEQDMPPDSTQVINGLPLLRKFAAAIQLHVIWVRHKPDYDELTNLVHDPLTRMIMETNIYLKQPTSTYDGRRFLVLLEPMLAPGQTNARIYGGDYIVVASPVRKAAAAASSLAASSPAGSSGAGSGAVGTAAATPADVAAAAGNDIVNMTQIRHTYLHYEIEPLVYAKASSMDRLMPILKTVREAPLDFTYRSDIVALLAESLIRAIEARTMNIYAATGLLPPQKPGAVKQRSELEEYDQKETAYLRQAEAARRSLVERDMRQGYVMTEYFYQQMLELEKAPESLKEFMGPMVYGMDVDHETRQADKVVFYPEGSADVVRRAPRVLHGLDLAEMDLIKGDVSGAKALAQKALDDKTGDPARANFLLARIDSMQGEMADAIGSYEATLKLSKDPRTLAWSHIYLGRIYDIQNKRPDAVAEYKAALTVRDSEPDTKLAAEKGLKEQFQSKRQLQAKAAGEEPEPDAGSGANHDEGQGAGQGTGQGSAPPASPRTTGKQDLNTPVPMVPDDNTPLPPPLPPAKSKK